MSHKQMFCESWKYIINVDYQFAKEMIMTAGEKFKNFCKSHGHQWGS